MNTIEELSPSLPQSPAPARETIGLRASLVAMIRLLGIWYRRYRQRRHLHGLPDYLLKDIGVSRAEAEEEARKFFWQE